MPKRKRIQSSPDVMPQASESPIAGVERKSELESKQIAPGTDSFPFGLLWNEKGSLRFLTSSKILPSAKIAAFDMDGTLITPKGKNKFPANRQDWKWWHSSVPRILQEKHSAGFNLVIFTNQAGISSGTTKESDITGKILDLIKEVHIPVQACIAADKDLWRKPNPDMWDFFRSSLNKDMPLDLKSCLYVGDAAGRAKNWKAGAEKDFGDSDRAFAHNADLAFFTPEEFFLQEKKAKFAWKGIDPQTILDESKTISQFSGSAILSRTQELVIFVGFPASGKSSFAKRHMSEYEWVNRDSLKTVAKCLKVIQTALAQGKSVVIDNTCPSVEARAEYIAEAKEQGIPVRCFHFATPRNVCEHLNIFRERVTKGERERVPAIAFNVYNKKFVAPMLSEGFVEICTVQFKPSFNSDIERQLFLQRAGADR